MKKRIPDKEAWGDLNVDPEVRYAFKLFGGKSIEEATPLFVEGPIERAAELRFASAEVFNYYIFCFVKYLTSAQGADESDGASCFLGLVRDRLAAEPEKLAKVWPELKAAVDHVAANQSFYDADENIYGSFREKRN